MAGVDAKKFPSDAPTPQPSKEPPPLSSAGRWLHTAVVIGPRMYIYGGISSYTRKLYNDVWLYNIGERSWEELQSNFVPPLPPVVAPHSKPNKFSHFHPKDIPAPPPVKMAPTAQRFRGMLPRELPPAKQFTGVKEFPRAIPVISLLPVERASPLRDPVFLEESVKLRQGGLQPGPAPNPNFQYPTMNKAPYAPNAPMISDKPLQPPVFVSTEPFVGDDLFFYDLNTRSWTHIVPKGNQVPPSRWLHSAVANDNKMIIFGGVSRTQQVLGDVWIFDPESSEWTKANPEGAVLPRQGHTAVVSGTQMIVFGGISYGYLPFNDVAVYDIGANSWTIEKPEGTVPPPRWLHTAVVYNNKEDGTSKMYIFGGVTREYIPLNDMYAYDIASKTWEKPKAVNYPPFPRMLQSMAITGQNILVAGGSANNMPFEDLWSYDMKTETWQELLPTGAFPFAREGATMVVLDIEEQEIPESPVPVKPTAAPDTDGAKIPRVFSTFNANAKKKMSPRPNRFRKNWSNTGFMVVFGGAGPVAAAAASQKPSPTLNAP